MVAVKINGRMYIRLENVVFATIEKHLEWMLKDEKFEQKIRNAYHTQVVCNRGWGFTVRHQGYVIRFDLQNSISYKLPRIYEGNVIEKPTTIQTFLEVMENE